MVLFRLEFQLNCSRLSVSEDDRKSKRATIRSAASGIRERKGEDLSFFPTRPHSSPARFFNPPLTGSLEQAKFQPPLASLKLRSRLILLGFRESNKLKCPLISTFFPKVFLSFIAFASHFKKVSTPFGQ